MKKTFIFVAVAFLLMGAIAVGEEAVVIDFTLLSADILQGADGRNTQNRHTVMDYSVSAGDTFADSQKALMKTSLSFNNWEVVLNSSARNAMSLATSRVVAAPVKADAKVPFAGKDVLGVRILFPTPAVNSNAIIVPPYTIPAFEPMSQVDDNGTILPPTDEDRAAGFTRFEQGYGLVKNVGTIKSLAITTMGMNFPHSVYLILEDADGFEKRYYMGNLLFDGWREMRWNNPWYIQDVRTRELRIVPIYPVSLPFVKFKAIQVVRDANDVGGDFVGYFKDVKIIFDKALITTDRDIADEDLWGIFASREAAKQSFEMSRFGNKQVERFLETEKQAQENGFTSSIQTTEETQTPQQ